MADEIELLRLVSELIPEPTTGAWARAEAAIAAAREEDLRASAADAAKTHRVPRRNRSRNRSRRRLALAVVAGVAAALTAGVVAVATIGVPGTRHQRTGGPDITAAYVVKRVDSALSAAGAGEIAQLKVTTTGSAIPGGATTTEEWSYADQWRSVTYSPAGRPVFDSGFGSSSVYTLVNYQARTWARQPGMGRPNALVPGPRSCQSALADVSWLFHPGLAGPGLPGSSTPSTVASGLRAAIACGALSAAGRQRVDGIEAIKLTSHPGSLISETIWVNPSTYLPVRVRILPGSGLPGSGLPGGLRTADITWLRPTAPNLAKLTVPVPAGFRQVPLAQAGRIRP